MPRFVFPSHSRRCRRKEFRACRTGAAIMSVLIAANAIFSAGPTYSGAILAVLLVTCGVAADRVITVLDRRDRHGETSIDDS